MASFNGRQQGSKPDPGEAFVSYMNARGPLLGTVEFDVSVPPPPVDAKLIDYDVSTEILKYELTPLELNERISTSYEFDQGLFDKNLETIAFCASGIEDLELIEALETAAFTGDDVERKIKEIGDLLKQSLQAPELASFKSLLPKAKQGLPEKISNLLLPNAQVPVSLEKPQTVTTKKFKTNQQQPQYARDWEHLSLEQKIDYYIDCVEKTFVDPKTLEHPFNPNAKIKSVHKVFPNQHLWKNRYIQVGIDGLASAGANQQNLLAVNGVLLVAKEQQAHCTLEYYKPTIEDVKNVPGTCYKLKYIRQYSYQKSSKTLGNANYFLLTLPSRLYKRMQDAVGKGSNKIANDDDSDYKQEGDDEIVEIMEIKGQKIVLNKAGVANRPDFEISITEPENRDIRIQQHQ